MLVDQKGVALSGLSSSMSLKQVLANLLKAISPLGFGLINLVLILYTSCAKFVTKVVRSLQLRTLTHQLLTRPNQLVFYFLTGRGRTFVCFNNHALLTRVRRAGAVCEFNYCMKPRDFMLILFYVAFEKHFFSKDFTAMWIQNQRFFPSFNGSFSFARFPKDVPIVFHHIGFFVTT